MYVCVPHDAKEPEVLKHQKVYGTRYSQAVTHPSTNRARRCLTSVIGREPVLSTWYGRRRLAYFIMCFYYAPSPLVRRRYCPMQILCSSFLSARHNWRAHISDVLSVKMMLTWSMGSRCTTGACLPAHKGYQGRTILIWL